MAKSEVLIEMPEFEKQYNLAMVEAEKISSRVRPKQFLHIDEAECILCEGCVDICPWKCIHYLSTDAIEDSINVEAPSMEENESGFFVVDEDACTRCALCVDRCPTGVISLGKFAKTPEYGGEGGGQKISTSTQELMTAAIVLGGKKYDSTEITVDDAKKIIEESKNQWTNIVGASGKESLLNQFTDNWYDLATAVSSANAILSIIPKPTKVFWTGQSWDEEIAPFNPAIGNIKDYNSSDIVVVGGNRYYGFSLKKKKKSKDADPTLINKPITGSKSLLKEFIDDKDMQTIERAKNLFFIRMVAAYKKTTNYSAIKKLTERQFKKEIAKIPNSFANDMLAGRGASGRKNIFWQAVNKVLTKDSKDMMIAFMKLIFKVDLQPILDESGQFDFYLLTGIGQKKGDAIGVEPAEVKDLPQTIDALTKIFKEDNIKLGKTVDNKGKVKRLPWEYEKGEKAPAKLFYTIYNGKIPLLNLEIRYKGSKTAEPQFQATATPIFKNLMSGK